MSDYLPTFDKVHPNAKRLMNEEFYWSPIEETAPFGSDDGADAYAGFKDWRDSHANDDPKDYLLLQIQEWDYPLFDFTETNIDNLTSYLTENELAIQFMTGIDVAIVAIAFGQLYLEGNIDADFKEIARTSINRQLNPALLSLWDPAYKVKREMQLTSMLAVLSQV